MEEKLHGDEEEALEVEDEIQMEENAAKPSSPSHSLALCHWDTDTDANGASSGASKAPTLVKMVEKSMEQDHMASSLELRQWRRMSSHWKTKTCMISQKLGALASRISGRTIFGIKAITKEMMKWKVKVKLHLHPSGWLVFKLQTLEDREKVLDGGPYEVYGKPLILKAMPNEFDYGDEEFTMVSIWVQLPDLPIAYRTPSALSKIGSKIGTPITSDLLTECKEHIAYARILVEVDVLEIHEKKKILLEFVPLRTKAGKILKQRIKYEYIPYYCTNCKMIGHDWNHCGYNEARFGSLETTGLPQENVETPPVDAPESADREVVCWRKTQVAGADARSTGRSEKVIGGRKGEVQTPSLVKEFVDWARKIFPFW